MKITINTEILSKENITLGEFLILLMGYHNIDYETAYQKLVECKLVEPDLFTKSALVLSDNTKNLVAKILMEFDERAINSGIDFDRLAVKLMECYPDGIKPGTTYYWRSTVKEVAQKLRVLVVKYDFQFTEEEAITATKEYVDSFKDYKHMKLLKYFLLKTITDDGRMEIDSPFMSIIENNRDESNN